MHRFVLFHCLSLNLSDNYTVDRFSIAFFFISEFYCNINRNDFKRIFFTKLPAFSCLLSFEQIAKGENLSENIEKSAILTESELK